MTPEERRKPAQLTHGEKDKIAKAVQRINTTPRGKWREPTTYHPGVTLKLNGKLTEQVAYNSSGQFKQWAAPDPTDPESDEEELEYPALPCYLWLAKEGDYIPSGWRVAVEWIGGRWYVCGAEDCPENDSEEEEE